MRLLAMTARTALRALRRNKLRSALTMLGVVIGVGAVIVMVSIGQGASEAVRAQIQSLGTNLLMVVPGATTSAGVRSGAGGVSTLTLQDAKAIAVECSAVSSVAWMKRQIGQVIQGERNWSTQIQGVSPDYFAVRDWHVESGAVVRRRATTRRRTASRCSARPWSRTCSAPARIPSARRSASRTCRSA